MTRPLIGDTGHGRQADQWLQCGGIPHAGGTPQGVAPGEREELNEMTETLFVIFYVDDACIAARDPILLQ
jgi:hypothetical protein